LRVIVFFHAGAHNFLWHFNIINEKVKRRPKFMIRLTKRSALVYMMIYKVFCPAAYSSFSSTRPGIDAGSIFCFHSFFTCSEEAVFSRQALPEGTAMQRASLISLTIGEKRSGDAFTFCSMEVRGKITPKVNPQSLEVIMWGMPCVYTNPCVSIVSRIAQASSL